QTGSRSDRERQLSTPPAHVSGELAPESLMASDADDPAERALALAPQGYGVANWYLLNDAPGKAAAIWAEIRATGSWSAFGYIAAEVDAARAEGASR
ncbi:MAG: hypothetical protein MK142_17555, partial [Pseudomonadales bacterium]|nr:hypothetical protein [Pseudomonadales bacterium]